jgi:hypothetical protein
MNRSFIIQSVLIVGISALVIGCAEQSGNVQRPVAPGEQSGPQVVYQAPPPPPEQAVVAAPLPEYAYAWIPGHWTWQGHWAWINGTWVPRPRPHAVWVPGQWAKRGHRYIWIRGRWE